MTENLKTQIQLAIGEASACWEHMPWGRFDAAGAQSVAERLEGFIESELEEARREAVAQREAPEKVNWGAWNASMLHQILNAVRALRPTEDLLEKVQQEIVRDTAAKRALAQSLAKVMRQ